MTAGQYKQTWICFTALILAGIAFLASIPARSQERAGSAAAAGTTGGTFQGYVRDSAGKPLANATVLLERSEGTQNPPAQTQVTHTDSEGAYRFDALREGAYTLHAGLDGYGEAVAGPVNLGPKDTKKIDVVLVSAKASQPQSSRAGTAAGRPSAQAPEFFDEPQFTVAGVTQATNSGGHGSDTVLRTTEALAKATVSLSKEPDKETAKESTNESAGSHKSAASTEAESSLRDTVARDQDSFEANSRLGKALVDEGKLSEAVVYLKRATHLDPNPRDPEPHHLLAVVEEQLGNPLEAVREYQSAAELDPREPYLFDWGAELLIHRALEPGIEVFTKGNRMFPRSVRMLLALGVAWYARGSNDQAAQCLINASDLDPGNPAPYLFLGKMQSVLTTPLEGAMERLARFAQLQPDNALANYYYAVALWKQLASAPDGERNIRNDTGRSARMEVLLWKAVHSDPKLGAAYLQLGILYSQSEDFSRAISAYERAIAVSAEEDSPQFDETLVGETLLESHYRLAQTYLRTGDKTRAKEELKLHESLVKKTKDDTARERGEIQEFVISLRSNNSGSPSQP